MEVPEGPTADGLLCEPEGASPRVDGNLVQTLVLRFRAVPQRSV